MYDKLKEIADLFIKEWPEIDEHAGQLEQQFQSDKAGDLYVKSKLLDCLWGAYKLGLQKGVDTCNVRANLDRHMSPNNEAGKCASAIEQILLRDGGPHAEA